MVAWIDQAEKKKQNKKKTYFFDRSYVCFINKPLKYLCGYLVKNDSIMRMLHQI